MSFSFNEPTATHPNATETPPDATSATTTTDAPTDTAATVPPVDGGEVDKDPGTEATEPAGGEATSDPDGEPKPDDTETPPELGELYFGDEVVEIEVPQDVTDALKEHGLDAHAIAKELYAKGSEFKLSAETREKLDAIYGKFAVDAYLGGLKAQNEGFINQLKSDAAAAEVADAERFTVVSNEVGGDAGWAALEAYALVTLSNQELLAFNEVMGSGNQYLQMYAVRELESRRKAAQGDDKVTLVDATSPAGSEESGPLSAQGYAQEYAGLAKKYGNDRVARAAAERALDARRRAGIKSGL